MNTLASSALSTHKPSRTAKFRGAFVDHFRVQRLVLADAKTSPGISQRLDQLAQYPFFTPPKNAGYALFVDVDRPSAVMDLYSLLPQELRPSWVVETPHGAQAGWFIDPVDLRDTARPHPIRYARAVGHALQTATNGDTAVDPLTPSRVRNPAYEPAGTFAAPTPRIYRLGELHQALDDAGLWVTAPLSPSRRAVVHLTTGPLTQGNRNQGVFDAARFVAYAGGDHAAEAWSANDRCQTPLAPSEVNTIINSISRFMANRGRVRTGGGMMPMPEPMRQALAEMGRRGGLTNSPAQQAARAKGPAAAAAARKHRAYHQARTAQHYRRRGYSRVQIATKLGRDPSTVSRYLRRWIPIPQADMLSCITGPSGDTTSKRSPHQAPLSGSHLPSQGESKPLAPSQSGQPSRQSRVQTRTTP